MIPDKTILRMTDTPEGPCAVLSNSRQLWHDHIDAGSIVAFCHNGTVLLDDSGYMQKLPVDHNMFLALPVEDEWLGYTPEDWENRRAKVGSWGSFDFQVRGLTGGRVSQSVAVECAVPSSMPIYQMRTMLLGRSGVMLVHDRVIPYNDDLQGSPLWHTETVHERGPGWALTSISTLRGVNGPWVHNGAERLYVIDPLTTEPWEEQDQNRFDVTPENVARNPRLPYWSLAQTTKTCLFRRRKLTRGRTHHFITLLVPESVAGTEAGIAEVLNPLEDDAIALSAGGALVVVNERVEVVTGEWGSTDARTLWFDGAGVSAHRLRSTELEGITVHSSDMPVDLDITFDSDAVVGHIAAEKPTTVQFTLPSGSAAVEVFGITNLNITL